MVFPNPFPGPVPLYANVPINAQYYEPSQFFISTIANGPTTIVTTIVNHNYVIGQLCRLIIPTANAEYQLNGLSGYVLSIPSANQVELNINSNSFDAFVTTTNPNQPQILAIGDINLGNTNASGSMNTSTSIPGAYINISPL